MAVAHYSRQQSLTVDRIVDSLALEAATSYGGTRKPAAAQALKKQLRRASQRLPSLAAASSPSLPPLPADAAASEAAEQAMLEQPQAAANTSSFTVGPEAEQKPATHTSKTDAPAESSAVIDSEPGTEETDPVALVAEAGIAASAQPQVCSSSSHVAGSAAVAVKEKDTGVFDAFDAVTCVLAIQITCAARQLNMVTHLYPNLDWLISHMTAQQACCMPEN